MTLLYFDTNAFVKLVIDEVGSELAGEMWNAADVVASSPLTVPETRAALAASFRRGDIDRAALTDAVHHWSRCWHVVRTVELTTEVTAAAGALAERHALSGADAVHLASALALRDGNVVMATWDRRLSDAARAAGLRVVPANP